MRVDNTKTATHTQTHGRSLQEGTPAGCCSHCCSTQSCYRQQLCSCPAQHATHLCWQQAAIAWLDCTHTTRHVRSLLSQLSFAQANNQTASLISHPQQRGGCASSSSSSQSTGPARTANNKAHVNILPPCIYPAHNHPPMGNPHNSS